MKRPASSSGAERPSSGARRRAGWRRRWVPKDGHASSAQSDPSSSWAPAPPRYAAGAGERHRPSDPPAAEDPPT
ncbi:MAG: hypothetical protein ACRDRA_04420, partial [Pseudonocardiaceae bacterium]